MNKEQRKAALISGVLNLRDPMRIISCPESQYDEYDRYGEQLAKQDSIEVDFMLEMFDRAFGPPIGLPSREELESIKEEMELALETFL